LSEVMLTPVHNEILGVAQYRDKYGLMGSATTVVQLPLLAPGLRKYVETPPFSFADSRLAAALDVPIDVKIELQRWLRRIFLEFRKLDMRILLTDLKSSIQL
jgi:hypothetical protein